MRGYVYLPGTANQVVVESERRVCGKQHGATIRQVKLRGQAKVSDVFTLSMLAVNLRRLPKLLTMQAMASSG